MLGHSIDYKIIVFTFGLILFAGSILGLGQVAFADEFDELVDVASGVLSDRDCPDDKKYESVCDERDPRVEIESPRNDDRLCSPVMITGTAFDNETGISQVLISINNGPYVPVDSYDPISKEFKHTTGTLSPGEYRVKVKAIDKVGNDDRDSVHFHIKETCDDPNICEVQVKTKDNAGEEFSGRWIEFFDSDENRIQRGFSPQTLDAVCGEEYWVKAHNYRSSTFKFWEDDHSLLMKRPFTATEELMLIAHMDKGPTPFPALTIKTVDKAGNERNGADFVNFFDAADLEIFNAAGFAPATLSMYDGVAGPILNGDRVRGLVLDFAGPVPGPSDDIMFYKWLSSPGNLNDPMVPKGELVLTKDTVWTAVMMGPSIDPPEPTICKLTIVTHNTAGDEYSGAWTQIFDANEDRIQKGFSPESRDVECGEKYWIKVSNFGDITFNEWWDDPSAPQKRMVSIDEDTTFTAHMNRDH